jgi:hypothetical protein
MKVREGMHEGLTFMLFAEKPDEQRVVDEAA